MGNHLLRSLEAVRDGDPLKAEGVVVAELAELAEFTEIFLSEA
jgi:hypothetical protein